MKDIIFNPESEEFEMKRDGYTVISFPFVQVYEAITNSAFEHNLTASETGGIRRRAKCLEFIRNNIGSIDLS